MHGHKYTSEERAFIRDFAPGHTYKQIVDEYNRRFSPEITDERLKGYLANHKINTGTLGHFPKGHVPANKGKKMQTTGRMAETQFKKGFTPANHKPVGTESIRNNYKRGQKYVYVKVADPNQWRMKHLLVWEKHNGPVVKGNIIIFLDGDSMNCDITNLAMVDRNTHARLNQSHLRTDNAELTSMGISTAKLICEIAKAERRKK